MVVATLVSAEAHPLLNTRVTPQKQREHVGIEKNYRSHSTLIQPRRRWASRTINSTSGSSRHTPARAKEASLLDPGAGARNQSCNPTLRKPHSPADLTAWNAPHFRQAPVPGSRRCASKRRPHSM